MLMSTLERLFLVGSFLITPERCLNSRSLYQMHRKLISERMYFGAIFMISVSMPREWRGFS